MSRLKMIKLIIDTHCVRIKKMMIVVRDNFMKYGVSFGTALAISISFFHNHSIPWAIIHGLLGWIYVFYYGLIL